MPAKVGLAGAGRRTQHSNGRRDQTMQIQVWPAYQNMEQDIVNMVQTECMDDCR